MTSKTRAGHLCMLRQQPVKPQGWPEDRNEGVHILLPGHQVVDLGNEIVQSKPVERSWQEEYRMESSMCKLHLERGSGVHGRHCTIHDDRPRGCQRCKHSLLREEPMVHRQHV